MADITILYWRDIPAQVLVGRGRQAVKLVLSERFEQAIDRAAMAAGLVGGDEYLAQWRKQSLGPSTDAQADAAREAACLEAHFDKERLMAIIKNKGFAPGDTSSERN